MGERSAIGLYDVAIAVSLLGFGIGLILAVFQGVGMVLVFSEMLYMCVRKVSAVLPRCLRCLMFMPSGPVELLLRACLMAVIVFAVVIVCWVGCSF